MANKSTKIKFDVEKAYKAMRAAGVYSIRDLCDGTDNLVFNGLTLSRKTINRAIRDGEASNRTLQILGAALQCSPDLFLPDEDDSDQNDNHRHVVYLTDGRSVDFFAVDFETPTYDNNIRMIEFYDTDDRLVASFKSACVMGWVKL